MLIVWEMVRYGVEPKRTSVSHLGSSSGPSGGWASQHEKEKKEWSKSWDEGKEKDKKEWKKSWEEGKEKDKKEWTKSWEEPEEPQRPRWGEGESTCLW